MKSFASPARLGVLAFVCAVAMVAQTGRGIADVPADGVIGEPPPLGGMPLIAPLLPPAIGELPLIAPLPPPPIGGVPVVAPLPPPAPPTPDCLPKDPSPPVVKVKVRVPACNAPGFPIEYRLCVENCSTAEAHHVILKNPIPANAKFVRADPEPDRLTPELQWQLGTIGGGACREVILVLQPTNTEDVKNCTRVQFEHGLCVTTRQAAYAPPLALPGTPGLPGVPGTVPPAVMPPAVEPPVTPPGTTPKPGTEVKLGVTVEGHKRQYVNLSSHYFITVANPGPSRATNVLVSCVLPAQMKLDRANNDARVVDGQVAWVLGDLEPGGRRTVELVARAQVEGLYCIRATARADRGAIARAEGCTQFIGVSALHVDLTDRNDPLVVGGRTSYSLLVRNQGSAPVTNLNVKAFIPAAFELIDMKGPAKLQLGERNPQGQWIEMGPLGKLDAMSSQMYEILVEARRPGETRMRVEVSADQLERGPVIEEESTTLFVD
jgi:hypothetical protein